MLFLSAEDQFHSNGWDTSEVRFVIRLIGDIGGIDTVICGIYDDLGGKVDSFHLFDDGNQEYLYPNTECEDERSSDSESGDGLYSRTIRPARVITNYSGAKYQFRFKAMKGNSSVATAEHWAESWAPAYTFTSVDLEPATVPLCTDSMRIAFTLSRDSTDRIDSISVGFINIGVGLHTVLGRLTAVSGDTMWRGWIAAGNNGWEEYDNRGLNIEVYSRLGLSRTKALSPYYTLLSPEVSLDATLDTFHVRETLTPDTFWIRANVVLCSGQHPDPVSAELIYFAVPTHWSISYGSSELYDCGLYGDEVAHDGIFTTYVLLVADAFAGEFQANIAVRSGATLNSDLCFSGHDRINSANYSKYVRFLPPQ